jgi:hypothetical protein
MDIDIWFRRTAAMPRTTAMFVHLIRREGQEPLPPTEEGKEPYKDFYNSDHQVVGGSFYLSEAPQDILIHDAFGVHLLKPGRGEWDVFVGFGHVSGKRGRSKVISPGKAEVNDDRIKIGSFTVH